MNNIYNQIKEVLSSFNSTVKESTFFSRIGVIFLSRFKMALNYKSSYLMTVGLNLVTILMYFFFSKMNPEMKIFGLDATYFEYAIVGLSLQMIVGTSLGTVSANIYNDIVSGTWSSILLNFNFLEYSLGTTLAGVLLSSISIFFALGIAYLSAGFYLSITIQEILIILLIFILVLFAHMAVSMLFASFTIFYQKSSGLVSLLYQLSKTFTGVVFPIALLSGFPYIISRTLPLTYALEALHIILYSPVINMNVIYVNCLLLLSFILILTSISYGLVILSIRNSKKNGKVDWY